MNQSINQSRRAKEARGNPRARRRAPSRPRAFPPPPRGGRRRETPTTRNPDDASCRAHRRVPPSRGVDATSRTQMRRRDPIVILYRSFVRSRSCRVHLIYSMRARVVFVFVFVRTLRPLPCRPNMSSSSSSVAVCARRMHPWTTTTGRAVASRVSRARCVSMFNARYTCFNREVVAPQPYLGLARFRF